MTSIETTKPLSPQISHPVNPEYNPDTMKFWSRYAEFAEQSHIPDTLVNAMNILFNRTVRTPEGIRSLNIPELAQQMFNMDFGNDEKAYYAISYVTIIIAIKEYYKFLSRESTLQQYQMVLATAPATDPGLRQQVDEELTYIKPHTQKCYEVALSFVKEMSDFEKQLETKPQNIMQSVMFRIAGRTVYKEKNLQEIRDIVENQMQKPEVLNRIALIGSARS